jgi:hypothetical protein
MLIDQYYTAGNGKISFTREQGSNFAKQIADDYNPIHDPESHRFCVPGDLLFSIIIARYGLSQHMEFRFTGMVDEGSELILPEAAEELAIDDEAGKQYLSIRRTGENTREAKLIDNLTHVYAEFSGHTFPDLLVPLLAEQNVMINPARPMVFYESMVIDLDRMDIETPLLVMEKQELTLNGKRGETQFAFNLVESGNIVGRGKKRMILAGLREYDATAMGDIATSLRQRKQEYLAR